MSSVVEYPSQGTVGTTRKPKRFDIDLYQGDTFAFDLVLGGDNLDVTGWTAVSTVKDDTDTVVSGVITIDDVDTFRKSFTIHVDSDLLSPGVEYKYDVQVTSGTAKRTFIGGKITVDEDITEL
jgi:hypothetical protein